MRVGSAVVVGALVLTVAGGCGRVPPTSDEVGSPTPASPSVTATSITPSPITPGPITPSPVTPSPVTPIPVTPSPITPTACPEDPPARLSLRGVQGRAFAFAPLDDPDQVVVEGDVAGAEAWSTSKVLVVAAFLDTTVHGDPALVSAADRRLIAAALSRSDADAVRALRQQIPGRPGRAMTAVLRSIGDTSTTVPDSLEGTMRWPIRQQVRFMTALAAGDVVSPQASSYLRRAMRPIKAHRWGLGRVGATAFKGGWLRQGRVTRQMGLLDGYAVAVLTDRGPVVEQSDGDSAHVEAMDDLAVLLAERLAYEDRCG